MVAIAKVMKEIHKAAEKIQAAIDDFDSAVKSPFCKTNKNNEICKALPSPAQPCLTLEQCGLKAFCAGHPRNAICPVATPLVSLPPAPFEDPIAKEVKKMPLVGRLVH